MKILLFSPIPPTEQYSGGIMLYHLCQMLPVGTVVCFWTNHSSLKVEISPSLASIPCDYVTFPPEKTPSGKSLAEAFRSWKMKRTIVDRAVRFARAQKVDCVWAVIQGRMIISTALEIAKKLRVPLVSLVWDDPVWSLTEAGYKGTVLKRLLRCFDETIRASKVCATASWLMASHYKKKYGIPTTVFLGVINSKLLLPPATKLNSSGELTIALAGQLYALKEWQALLSVLDSIGWVIDNRRIKIILIGRFDNLSLSGRENIKVIGYKSQRETVKILSRVDICYCPYWFDKKFRPVTETSFPGKLSTYFAAGRPVLFHGPKYSSPARFLEKNKAGLCCYSLRKEDIFHYLERLVRDRGLYGQLTRNGRSAFQRYLSLEKMEASLGYFLKRAYNAKHL